MALITKAIKGTKDVLPAESYKTQFIERTCIETAEKFGCHEIRVPVFEHTELFQRGVGDTTDVVQKEMYTFEDKGGRSITLRPEFTAGVARSMLENGLLNEALPQKACYAGACYRYEKPQAGRYREFHQFGVEYFGTSDPLADAELISLGKSVFDNLGVTGLTVEINSIGCPACRSKYHQALKAYFGSHEAELCDTCRGRLERNPMRILDCKSPVCAEIAKGAPVMLDYLCEECSSHFEAVKKYLNAMGIAYKINPHVVRGLDYYTKTVFEFVSDADGLVCGGGGRYDGLVEELGGAHTPSLGFAMGLERIQLQMETQGVPFPEAAAPDLFLITMGEQAALKAVEIAKDMREEGFSVGMDLNGRSLRAQMKYANKNNARFTVVLGEEEMSSGIAKLKNMESGEASEIPLDTFVTSFYNISLAEQLADIEIGEDKLDFSTFFGLGEE